MFRLGNRVRVEPDMSTLAPSELVGFLGRHQLITPGQQDALAKEVARYPSAVHLCADLVQRGWMTTFQQQQIAAGQHEKLVLGPYRLVQAIGEGGMGMVFKAYHPRLDRWVVLKTIRPQVLAARPEIVTRFHREARAIAQLNHPNVVILFDADEVNGTHYIAMEYVDGVTLDKMVRQSGPLGVRQACDYMRQSALGLQHAFEVGLVHRDIKPSNILVAQKSASTHRSSSQLARPALVTVRDREAKSSGLLNRGGHGAWGVIKILDMGLARLQETIDEENQRGEATPLTRAGALLGTPDFIAPEQARDARTVDIRADLYSLGCTFYYVLTGRPPFPGGTDVQKLFRHQTEKPYPIDELRPHVPQDVVAAVAKLMAKKVDDRFQTPQQLAEALDVILTPSLGSLAETPAVAETPIPEAVAAADPVPDARPVSPGRCALPVRRRTRPRGTPPRPTPARRPTRSGRGWPTSGRRRRGRPTAATSAASRPRPTAASWPAPGWTAGCGCGTWPGRSRSRWPPCPGRGPRCRPWR